MTDWKAIARMEAKARMQSAVDRPRFHYAGQCWAQKRIYAGALFPSFVDCNKKARPGHLTCWHHKDREEAAQELKTSFEKEVKK